MRSMTKPAGSKLFDLLRQRQERGLSTRGLEDFYYESKSEMYCKNLQAHFGCVNALAFSPNGQFIASGGDDRRILCWNVAKAITISQPQKTIHVMHGKHESNVFCVDFDCQMEKVISGGNDEKVLVHDFQAGKTVDIFPHDEPVYCVACHPDCSQLFATACSDGRVLLFDLRASTEDPVMLHGSSYAFHGVCFNPGDPRLLVTANQNAGVTLLDHRKPNKAIMRYGKKASAMCAKFSPDGSKILALGRRLNPVLYDIAHPKALVEFDHPGYLNSCTMKSGSFGHGYVFSGSDDFNVYAWKVPDEFEGPKVIKRADLVLTGHRSIVNQVRHNATFNIIATSGVEKKIKFWSPFNITNLETKDAKPSRKIHRREDYFCMITNSVDLFDCEHESVEENPKMLAFFDNLVQRDLSSEDNDEDSDETLSIEENSSSSSSTEEDIDSVIAKKRELISHKRTKQRTRSQDSSDYVKQTIQSAREALCQSSSDESLPEGLRNPPKANPNMHRDILEALTANLNDTTEEEDESEEGSSQSNSRQSMFKRNKGSKGRCYRTQN